MKTWQLWKGAKNWHFVKPQHKVVSFEGEALGTWLNAEEDSEYIVSYYAYVTKSGSIIIQRLEKARKPSGTHYSIIHRFRNIDKAAEMYSEVLYNMTPHHPLLREWRERWLNS